jgi:hypothetical protein
MEATEDDEEATCSGSNVFVAITRLSLRVKRNLWMISSFVGP